ncbi:hypothetical protein ACQUQP_03345 [Marinobacterium sp. YM272]|uniref:cyanase n=1 Tax=Marinobacterium sp. YM272 TaxID=3421654 RepID=UPI003D7FF60B
MADLFQVHEGDSLGHFQVAHSVDAIQREEDPKGDRVSMVMSGKLLPYKSY